MNTMYFYLKNPPQNFGIFIYYVGFWQLQSSITAIYGERSEDSFYHSH